MLKGNYGEKVELQATYAPQGSGITDAEIVNLRFASWNTPLPASPCGPSQRHGWKSPPMSARRFKIMYVFPYIPTVDLPVYASTVTSFLLLHPPSKTIGLLLRNFLPL
jgi:allantoicase